MPDRMYNHRSVVEKFGLKPGHAVAVAPVAGDLDATLLTQVLDCIGRPLARGGEMLDVVLASIDAASDVPAVLGQWRDRINSAGAIWLLSPKRTCPGYVDQRELIAAGLRAGLVDNKVCAVSTTISAMRFVIRRADRPVVP